MENQDTSYDFISIYLEQDSTEFSTFTFPPFPAIMHEHLCTEDSTTARSAHRSLRRRFHDVEKANHSPRWKSKDGRLTDRKEESARETTWKLYLSRTFP